jgi:phenylacetate-CoA ligase
MNRLLNKYLIYYPAVFARGQNVTKYLWRLERSQWFPREQLQQIQLRKLKVLLSNAKVNVPYYRAILADIDPASFQSISEIEKIPVLTKEMLKENFAQLDSTRRYRTIKKTTGGSTGNPVTIYKSADSSAAAYAAYWRGYKWAGVGIGYRQARFWGVPNNMRDKRMARWTDWITNRYRCSAFAFDEKDLGRYYEDLNRFKPHYFYGYVSMMEAFARFLLKNRLELKFQLSCVISTSEVLTGIHRQLFNEAFQCAVFNEYGCGEVGTIAHECEHGSMHLSAENLIVEILHDGRPAAIGEQGDIVVTELNNHAMPLIRYNLRDAGVLGITNCPCGRGLPLIDKIVGRAYDVIYNRNGQAFHGEYFMYIFEELQRQGIAVSAFQVIQLDYERFLVKLVMSERDRGKVEEYVQGRVRATYGDYVNMRFEYVQHIEREKSGKIRLIKSMGGQSEAAVYSQPLR